MSAADLQTALVTLVRLPDHHRGAALETLLAGHAFSDRERWQVRALAASPLLAKFGREQRRHRFERGVRKAMPVSVRVLGEAAARRLFADDFEPAHPRLATHEVGAAFAAHLLAAAPRLAPAEGWPPFFVDLLRCEFTEFAVFSHLARAAWQPPAESPLRPQAPIEVIELEHDLPPYLEAARANAATPIGDLAPPQRRPIILLFAQVRLPAPVPSFACYQFEIDAQVRDFFSACLQPGRTPSPAPCHATLVELGICKPLAAGEANREA